MKPRTPLAFATAFSILLLTLCVSPPLLAESGALQRYFAGSMVHFGYGSGISSNNPRVEMAIHYCASGTFYSSGRSCRPNLIAKGYQCSQFQDYGQWQVVEQNGQAMLQWYSANSGPGGVALQVRGNGTVTDPRGNPFVRVGAAQCQ